MEYRNLGRSGMKVSAVGLGTMMFGGWGNTDQTTSTAMVDLALDVGINFFDSADVYDQGVSETMLGVALEGRRDDVVLATKAFNPMGDDPNQRGLSRRWLNRAVEDSLRRLGTDRIDLYQMHRPDPDTAIDDTMAALDDLVAAGKVLAVGTSTFPADKLVEVQWACERNGLAKPVSEQPPYSILTCGVEREVLPTCLAYDMGAVVWGPLNGGWLTGKYSNAAPPSDSRATRNNEHFDFGGAYHDQKLQLVGRLAAVATEAGCPLTALALGFVLTHPAVSSAIIGPRTPEQLDQLLRAAAYRPGSEVLDRIDEIVAPGMNVNPSDAGYENPNLVVGRRRRRRLDMKRPEVPAAIVTGAAQGIGRAIAERLAADGARVALLDVNDEVVEVAAGLGGGVGLVVDLADPRAAREAAERAVAALDGAWLLVNNAGIFAKTPLLDVSVTEWDTMMAVNVRSMLVTIQAVAPVMIEAGGGRVVNQASMAAKLGTPQEASYAASKAAVAALTRIAAQELGSHKITVNCLCPGYVLTEMGAATRDPDQIRGWEALSPLGRLGTPDDVAAAVAFLASDDAAYITGESLNVSGGMFTS